MYFEKILSNTQTVELSVSRFSNTLARYAEELKQHSSPGQRRRAGSVASMTVPASQLPGNRVIILVFKCDFQPKQISDQRHIFNFTFLYIIITCYLLVKLNYNLSRLSRLLLVLELILL